MNVLTFFRGMVPTQMQIEWGAVVSAIGTAFSYICGWDGQIEALMLLMLIDYISGVMAAYINPNMSLNSQRGFKGILKKIMIMLLVALAHIVDRAIGQAMAQAIVVWFFIGNEGLSIIENAAKAGLPVPEKLKQTLEQLMQERIDKDRRR